MNKINTFGSVQSNSEIISADGAVRTATLQSVEFSGDKPLPGTVVVCIRDIKKLLKLAFLLDGTVENLAILSVNMPQETLYHLSAKLGEHVIVTDLSSSELPGAFTFTEFVETFQANKTNSTRWILATSGTTDVPKLVSHSFESLTKTVKSKSSLSELNWGLIYDPARFAGLQVVLQAVISGARLIVPPYGGGLSESICFLKENNVSALSATPTLWRKVLLSGFAKGWELKNITLGGEIAEQSILDALVAAFPGAKIRHIYASTEAGAGFSVADKLAGFPAEFIDNPPPGLELRVEDNRLHFKNNLIGKDYVGTSNTIVDADGFIDTGDVVERRDGRYYFRGRANGVINVGGNKVYPEAVENLLKELPGIAFIRIYGSKSSIVGELVGADVVLEEGENEQEVLAQLRAYSAKRLKSFERPIKYRFVDEIDHSENGKIVRS